MRPPEIENSTEEERRFKKNYVYTPAAGTTKNAADEKASEA